MLDARLSIFRMYPAIATFSIAVSKICQISGGSQMTSFSNNCHVTFNGKTICCVQTLRLLSCTSELYLPEEFCSSEKQVGILSQTQPEYPVYKSF